MGCSNSREIFSDSEIEAIIQSTTKNLGLFQYKAEYLDRVIHRNSKNLKISESQLNHIQQTLKLDVSNKLIRAFFTFFYSENKKLYDTKKLATLGILLGKGTLKEKSLLLFQNYDTDLQGSLTKSQLKKMINHINYISCCYLPAFSAQYAESGERHAIEKYKNKMCIMLKGVTNYFCNMIFEEFTEEFEKFEKISKITTSLGLNGIFDPEMCRKKTMEICKTIQKATAAVDFYMITENKEFRQRCKNFSEPSVRRRHVKVESGKSLE